MIEASLLIDGIRHSGDGTLDEFVKHLEQAGLCSDLASEIRKEKERLDLVIAELRIT